ncbi:hypothetical protein NO2_0735 [Candidatus Termititenax persephonae]|uniref:Uncharacterized protein n=1 Tax=Candidatus Termititenax persephonae TaxID=2218525 RepID=A0A388TH38_9BACT|nr:hypothetical protein NO2_0735 [Candidatus Termititenax persephonae]
MEAKNKFNENAQIFSPDQLSKIFNELDLDPQRVSQVRKTTPGQIIPPSPQQSVEDILRRNFIEDDQDK